MPELLLLVIGHHEQNIASNRFIALEVSRCHGEKNGRWVGINNAKSIPFCFLAHEKHHSRSSFNRSEQGTPFTYRFVGPPIWYWRVKLNSCLLWRKLLIDCLRISRLVFWSEVHATSLPELPLSSARSTQALYAAGPGCSKLRVHSSEFSPVKYCTSATAGVKGKFRTVLQMWSKAAACFVHSFWPKSSGLPLRSGRSPKPQGYNFQELHRVHQTGAVCVIVLWMVLHVLPPNRRVKQFIGVRSFSCEGKPGEVVFKRRKTDLV
jgi:hypothetical protein